MDDVEISDKRIDGGKAFDWGRTSREYARYRDIYPDVFYRKIVDRGLCIQGQRVLDLGTGGGFPGIPLAIFFPEVRFHLVDSIGKKIRVCNEVISALGLENVTTQHARTEEIKYQKSPKKLRKGEEPAPAVGLLAERFDFVVSRAVMPLADLVKISRPHISQRQQNALPNGLIALKGGELEHEAAAVKSEKLITPLSDYFQEEYFQTKKVVYVQL